MAQDGTGKRKGGLSSIFNSISFGGIAKFVFQSLVIGLLVGGLMDFTLFHEHPMGKYLLGKTKEPLLKAYDSVAHMIGQPTLARNTEYSGEAQSTTAQDLGVEKDVIDNMGECTTLDEDGIPMPCLGDTQAANDPFVDTILSAVA